MHKTLSLFKFCCAFPLKFNNNLKKYEKLPFKWMYGSCLIAFNLIIFATMAILIKPWQKEPSNIEKTVMFYFKLIQQLAAVALLASCSLFRKSLMENLNLYLDIDGDLRKINLIVNYRYVRIFYITKTIASLTGIMITSCYIFIQQDATASLIYTMEQFVIYLLLSQYLSVVYCLLLISHKKFTILNSLAGNIVLKGKLRQENSLKSFTALQFKLIKATNMITKSYGCQLFIIVNLIILKTIGRTHYLLNNQSTMIVTDTFWLIVLIFELFLLFLVGTKVEEVAKIAPKIISMICCGDELIDFEKEMFLLQSEHHKLSLDICGLFRLDNRAFLQFCATTLTYIILLQGINK